MANDMTTLRRWAVEQPQPGSPRITVTAGPGIGQVFTLCQARYLLGRDPRAEICVQGGGVSRRHAQLVIATESLVNLVDLGSTNGTRVNQQRIDVAVLRDGDAVELGPEVRLRFSLGGDALPAAAGALLLTSRQLEIARMVARGLTNPEIARNLGLSARTVASHLDHVYTRLMIGSRAELTRVVTERDLLRPTSRSSAAPG